MTTIREAIQRRYRRWMLVMLFGAAMVFADAMLAHDRRVRMVLIWPALLVFTTAAFACLLTQCPVCGKYISSRWTGGAATIAFPWGQRRVTKCPECGVNLDEPMPHHVIE